MAQLLGFTVGNAMEVDANTHAGHVTLRDNDAPVYRVAGASGIMAAGIGVSVPIFSFQWAAASKFALVRRFQFSAGGDTVAFAIGIAQWHIRKVVGFTAPDSGGTSLLPTGNMNKLRASMAATAATDIRIATTGTLTAGTRVIAGNGYPVASAMSATLAAAGAPLVPPTLLINRRPGEYPFVLAPNEGLILTTGASTFPATGTWKFAVMLEWMEKSSYP